MKARVLMSAAVAATALALSACGHSQEWQTGYNQGTKAGQQWNGTGTLQQWCEFALSQEGAENGSDVAVGFLAGCEAQS